MRSILAALFLCAAGDLADARAQTIDPIRKNEIVQIAVKMTKTIKDLIDTQYRDRSVDVYTLVSTRLLNCAVLYGVFSKITSVPADQKQQFSNGAGIYYQVGQYLYPLGAKAMDAEVAKAPAMLERLRQDDTAQFYFLRNCKDFGEPTSTPNAVTELLLKAGQKP